MGDDDFDMALFELEVAVLNLEAAIDDLMAAFREGEAGGFDAR